VKKLLMIQPGPFGDIFVCAPIAKWYADRGYEVHWPVSQKFSPTLEYFDYVKPIILGEEILHDDWLRSDVMKIVPLIGDYEKVINLADRGPHPTAQAQYENFEVCKYRLAEVPFSEKNNLSFTRNTKKENELFEKLGGEGSEPYAIVHRQDSLGQQAPLPEISLNTIEVSPVKGYNIPDWMLLFSRADEIYCVESAVHQFMDGVVNNLTEKRYLLKRPVVTPGTRFTMSTHWRLDHIGRTSVVRG